MDHTRWPTGWHGEWRGVALYQRLWDDMCTFFDGCSGTVCTLPQRNSASAAHVYLGWLTDRAMHWTTQVYITRLSRDPPTAHTVPLQHQRRCTYRPTTVSAMQADVSLSLRANCETAQFPTQRPITDSDSAHIYDRRRAGNMLRQRFLGAAPQSVNPRYDTYLYFTVTSPPY